MHDTEYVPDVGLVYPELPAEVPCSSFTYSLTRKSCLSQPFDPVGNGRIMRLTTFFGQPFFT